MRTPGNLSTNYETRSNLNMDFPQGEKNRVLALNLNNNWKEVTDNFSQNIIAIMIIATELCQLTTFLLNLNKLKTSL